MLELTSMTTNASVEVEPVESSGDKLPADARISVADTGSGLLVFEADAEFRDHLDREVIVSKELVGFADVDRGDWSAIKEALRARGLGVGAVTDLPVFDVDDLPAAEVDR